MFRDNRYTLVFLSFFALYFIWGSTYVAIRIAIETMPPLIMLGFRFGVAGVIMYAWLLWRGIERPSWLHWRNAVVSGGLMLLGGTGIVAVSMYYVPSGMAALTITTVPLWMVLLDWLWKKGPRPSLLFFGGFIMGLIGVSLLVDPTAFLGTTGEGFWAILCIIIGAINWCVGSIFGRDADTPEHPFMSTAIQMMMGGLWLFLAGWIRGETFVFTSEILTLRSMTAWLYLLIFGSFIAFSAYIWLLRNVSPGRVATYAYVNPVIAVYLGWALAGEPITPRIIVGSLLLVGAVIIVVGFDKKSKQVKSSEEATQNGARQRQMSHMVPD